MIGRSATPPGRFGTPRSEGSDRPPTPSPALTRHSCLAHARDTGQLDRPQPRTSSCEPPAGQVRAALNPTGSVALASSKARRSRPRVGHRRESRGPRSRSTPRGARRRHGTVRSRRTGEPPWPRQSAGMITVRSPGEATVSLHVDDRFSTSAPRPFHKSEIGSARLPSPHGSISNTRLLTCASADGELALRRRPPVPLRLVKQQREAADAPSVPQLGHPGGEPDPGRHVLLRRVGEQRSSPMTLRSPRVAIASRTRCQPRESGATALQGARELSVGLRGRLSCPADDRLPVRAERR